MMKTLVRRLLASAHLLIIVVLLGVLFIFVNFIAMRRYARWEFSKVHVTALSQQTRETLRALKEPVTVVVFYQPTHRLYQFVKDQLDEYERACPRLKIEYVDPEQDIARAKQLAQQLQIDELNVVVFQAGERHKYVTDADLAEYDYAARYLSGPAVKAFKGEEAFTSAILNVTQRVTRTVWVTTGHGEKSLEPQDQMGLSQVKKFLEQQNMTIQSVTLLERATIPSDVTLLVIAGPVRRFTDAEVGLLHAYLEQGGRILALLDPLTDTGLDGFLAKWGVQLGLDIVVDPARQLPFVSGGNLFVTTYTKHAVVEKMKTLMTLFPLARSVRPAASIPSGLTVTPLAQTSADGWGESNTSVNTFAFNEGQDLKGPVSIAAACEGRLASAPPLPEDRGGGGVAPPTMKMVVIGDADFVADAQLSNVGNKDFLLGAVYWLLEQEQLIGIGPKALESVKLHLSRQQVTHMFWFSFLGMPAVLGALGAMMWWLRRR